MLVVLDPGFHDWFSHHNRVAHVLADASRGRGLVVLAHESLGRGDDANQPDVEVRPHFRGSAYVQGLDLCTDSDFTRASETFAEDCLVAMNQYPGSRLLVHTAFSYHILGLAMALAECGLPPSHISISLMFPPDDSLTAVEDSRITHKALVWGRYSNAIGLLRGIAQDLGVSVNFGVSAGVLAESLSGHLGLRIHDHGPVTEVRFRAADAETWRRPRVLVFAGAPKGERGIDLALASVDRGVALGLQVEWWVQVNTRFNLSDDERQRLERAVKSLESYPNVKLVRGALAPAEYEKFIASSDVAWILLDPVSYGHKTSGLVWDLLAAGTDRFVALSGSHPQEELSRSGAAVIALEGPRAEDVARATALLVENSGPGRKQRSSSEEFARWALGCSGEVESRGNHAGVSVAWKSGVRPKSLMLSGAKRSVLVVRSLHTHLSGGAGPTEFIRSLKKHGVEVKVIDLPLRQERVSAAVGLPACLGAEPTLRWHVGELGLLEDLDRFDVVHFVDGEHAGGLSSRWPRSARVVTTFHQPASVLRRLIQRDQLEGVDVVHSIAPDQAAFLDGLSPAPVVLIPHGERDRWGPIDTHLDVAASDVALEQTVLTVGAWLRDQDIWFKVAERMACEDVQFVWLGPPREALQRELASPNVYLADTSVSSVDLRAWYMAARVVFLPLQDATANNCLLEARSLGRPLIVTDVPATRYYAAGAVHVPIDVEASVSAIREVLEEPPSRGLGVSYGTEFKWEHVADRLVNEVYFP